MSDFHSINPLVWPQPPSGHQYAESTFGGNSYVSTGFFAPGSLGFNGQGKEVSNLTGLCSYLFDADLIDLVDAWRIAHGQTLEGKVAERKKWIYDNLDDAQVETLKASLRDAVEDALLPLMDFAPTLTVDSGWGWHFYYAFGESLRDPSHLPALQELHKRIVAAVNAEIATKAESILGAPGIFDSALDQATNDVGTRISRIPGTMNVKCSTRHKLCQVVDSDDETVLGFDDVAAIIGRLPAAQKGTQGHSKASKKVTSPAAAVFGQSQSASTIKTMDFAILSFQGQSLFDLAMSLNPGEQTDIICPFGGTSVGSAFVAKGLDGALRLHSNAMGTTFFHKAAQSVAPPAAVPPAAPGTVTLAVLQMKLDAQGNQTANPETTRTNLLRVLEGDSRFDFWYDDFRQLPMNGKERLSDNMPAGIALILEQDYNWSRAIPSKDTIWDYLMVACMGKKRDPVVDHLNSLTWDGTARLNEWIERTIVDPGIAAGCDAPDAKKLAYYGAISRRWAIALISRAMNPGEKQDDVLVLKGRQGFRKSSIFKMGWCGHDPSLFADTHIDLRSNDRFMMLAGAWIYEDAEMSSGTMADESKKKNFISSSVDTFRPPYGRMLLKVKRHTVLVGSTNDDVVLKDSTGSRRYWVVDCPTVTGLHPADPKQPVADLSWLEANREQLLAEAVAAFKAGEQHWLSPEEDYYRAQDNEQHTFVSVWEEAAKHAFEMNGGGVQNGFSTTDFAEAIDPDITATGVNRINFALRSALKHAGFERAPVQVKGRSQYYKPLPPGVTPISGDGLNSLKSVSHGKYMDSHGRKNSFR